MTTQVGSTAASLRSTSTTVGELGPTRREHHHGTIPTTTQPAPPGWLKRFIIHHPVAAFLGLVYGSPGCCSCPPSSQSGIGVLPFEIPVTPFLLLSTVFGITLPAFVVTRVTQGKEGAREH